MHLSKHVSQLVTQQGAGGRKGGAERINCLVRAVVPQREHGPHALEHSRIFVLKDNLVIPVGSRRRGVNRTEITDLRRGVVHLHSSTAPMKDIASTSKPESTIPASIPSLRNLRIDARPSGL